MRLRIHHWHRATLRAGTLVSLTLVAGLWLCGCGPADKSGALPPNAVAVVGDKIITAEAFLKELAQRGQPASGRHADLKEKAALLEEMIRLEVLYQKALAAGYDKDPQIVAGLKRIITAKYQEDQLAKLGRPGVRPEEITNYYRANPQRFGTPEKVRVALIEFKTARTATPEKRAEIARKAHAVLAEAKAATIADGTFGLLAQNHSEDQSSRYQGGDIGWLRVGDTNVPWSPAVLSAISRLAQPGDFAQVIETPAAFYLVRLVERQPPSMRPLNDMKDGIGYLVARQKEEQQQQAFYDRIGHELNVRTNHALVESIRLPVNQLRPPGGPSAFSAEARTP